MIKVPTISALFPNVIGEEPVFLLSEETRISGLSADVAFRRGGKVVDSLPVDLSLARGRDYLELSLMSPSSGLVNHFLQPPFRSKLGKILEAGGGVAAAYVGMGEWSALSDHRLIGVPEVGDEPAAIDALVDFLIRRLGESS
ncbi:hypothetical protein [Paludisphaera soli]|uniref:hypothetical protein n=1 Tax=Paludisphaera soli TaxID=2712865 RepID=UPI0013EB3AAF|nr:hypothetical protein [Paludisphaera soli]